MTYYPDLSPCDYFSFPAESSDPSRLLAIGWLEVGQAVPRGVASPHARNRLASLVRNTWSPITFMGGHSCSLCLGQSISRAIEGVPSSFANMFVPAENCVFVSPELISHYVEDHGYAPPDQFWAAVERCPPMWSDRYFAALGRVGHQALSSLLPPGTAPVAAQPSSLAQEPVVISRVVRPWSLLLDWQRKLRLWRRVNSCLGSAQSKLGVGSLTATGIAPTCANAFVVTVRVGLPIEIPAPRLARELEMALDAIEGGYIQVDLRMPDE